ncbi:MAG: response regulator [Thermodesulfobacteriota bacterium]
MSKADILIIDDERDLVESLRVILEIQDYRVRAAYNGRDGLALAEAQAPDLFILDVMMTTVTEGFDLAYKIKRHPRLKDVPILLVSGFMQKMAELGPDKFQHILGQDWPVNAFLEKPLDPLQLLDVIDGLLKDRISTEVSDLSL